MKRDIQLILQQLDIIPNKKLGQNFLIDKNIIAKIIKESEILKDDIILEIGAGLGALTNELIKRSKKVFAYEIDKKLYDFLRKKFNDIENIEIYNKDILKAEIPFYNKIISNIPYSITGPILEKIFYKDNPPNGTLIIEKNIADRIFFKEKYKNFSRITITFNAFMKPVKQYKIPRNSFYPIPNIELSLIKIAPREDPFPFLFNLENRKFFLKFIAGIMPYKNKNLLNALELFFKKESLKELTKSEVNGLLKDYNYENDKLMRLNIKNFVELCELILNHAKKLKIIN